MSNLEKLYYNFHKLSGDDPETREVREARDNVENALGSETYFGCEDEITMLESLNEKQGFIKGFRYAVSLLTDGKAVAV